MTPLTELEHSISLAMQADQFSLRKMMRAVKDAQKAGKPFDKLLEKLTFQLEKSKRRREERAVWQPRLLWDEELPVVARKQEIIDTIRDNQVVVLCGETGSGKSTQLPKILVEMGRGIGGVIGHTQPRRIAARSVAARLAEEMNCKLGQEVGFRIRFTDSSTPNTRVRLMTDGILLAETQTDRFLDQYDTIIVDEAHERSLNIDFLLGYLKRLLPRRRDLKVIITSATIDAARFAEHFGTVARSVSDRDSRTFEAKADAGLGTSRGERISHSDATDGLKAGETRSGTDRATVARSVSDRDSRTLEAKAGLVLGTSGGERVSDSDAADGLKAGETRSGTDRATVARSVSDRDSRTLEAKADAGLGASRGERVSDSDAADGLKAGETRSGTDRATVARSVSDRDARTIEAKAGLGSGTSAGERVSDSDSADRVKAGETRSGTDRATVARSVSDRDSRTLEAKAGLGSGTSAGERVSDSDSADRVKAAETRSGTDRATGVPVLQISGRMYPVDIRYRPLDDPDGPMGEEDNREPRDWLDGVTDAVEEVSSIDSGHILVFLPTERDIREAAKKLSGKRFRGDTPQVPTEIVPLFGRLSMADQTKVFSACSHRRIVLATNVAESSLTVPGIRYVIDTGTARISRYSARSRMQRLPIEPVSQASANQRAGRCGRVGPGICIRLYSKEDFDAREAFTAPEIQRTNLAAVILRTINLRLGNIEEFPFLDPPRSTTVREGYKTLEELGAITPEGELTEVGRRMARLPVDPRISRMILAAVDEHALPEVLAIAAMLESQDPRERPVEKQQAADEAHRKFYNRDSDFLTILNLWDAWHEQQRTQSQGQIRKWCQKNFLSFMRMREWADVHTQLKDLLADSDDPAIAKAARHSVARSVPDRDSRTSQAKAGSGSGKSGGERVPGSGAARGLKAGETRSETDRATVARSVPDRDSRTSEAKAGSGSGKSGGERVPGSDAARGLKAGETRSETDRATGRHNDFAATHKALMTGLLANIGYQTPNGDFMGAGGNSLAIWPGSALAPKGAKWFVAGELVETSRRFARTIARIQPEWIEPLAGHLVTREYMEPHWDPQAGNIMVFEKVSLWGLPIVPRRKVTYAKVDPVKAREMLIQHGLVEFGLLFGDTDPDDQAADDYDDEEEALSRGASKVRPGVKRGHSAFSGTEASGQGKKKQNVPFSRKGWGHEFPFLRHNHDVLEQLKELQAKTRSHHLMPGDETLFEFYASQIPEECSDRDRLRRWFQRTVTRNARLCQFDINQFSEESHRLEQAAAFPESAQFGAMHLPLSYQLDPGRDADGVTVTVPVEGLGQLNESRLEWLVPGLLEQKVLALIRSLPKHFRRHFVPAPETAKLVASDIEFGKGDLLTGVASRLSQLGGERFDSREFDLSTLDDHLKFNILVVDDQRKKIIEGRDLKELRQTLIQRANAAVASAEKAAAVSGPSPEEAKWMRTGFKAWDFFDIPEHIEIKRAGMLLRSFPSLKDEGESVGLMLCQTPEDAGRNLRLGLRKLILLSERKRILLQIGNMPQIGQVKLLSSSIKGLELMSHLSQLMVDRAYLAEPPLPRTKASFDKTLQRGRERLGVIAQEFVQFMPHLFQQYHETRRALEQARGPGWDHLLNGMKQQLAVLVQPTFLVDTPWPWLIQFPRYFTGIRQRLQRLSSGGLKTELSLESEFAPWLARYEQKLKDHQRQHIADPMLVHFRWMLEEFRIQLFAQKLGTAISVSSARLDEHWGRIQ